MMNPIHHINLLVKFRIKCSMDSFLDSSFFKVFSIGIDKLSQLWKEIQKDVKSASVKYGEENLSR